jgi:hypothetical protein
MQRTTRNNTIGDEIRGRSNHMKVHLGIQPNFNVIVSPEKYLRSTMSIFRYHVRIPIFSVASERCNSYDVPIHYYITASPPKATPHMTSTVLLLKAEDEKYAIPFQDAGYQVAFSNVLTFSNQNTESLTEVCR